MASWKQVKDFDINKMGRESGMCLKNVRLGFGIGSKFANAKADMENNKSKGWLHDINDIPKDVAVPVYIDSTSKYEHIMVCDHGTYYSDGKKLTSINGLKAFGWGESVNDVKVVEYVGDTKKSNEEIADEVIAGKWGNGGERKRRLTEAGYDYSAVQAIVDSKMAGNTPSSDEIKVGDKVLPIRWVDYRGIALSKTRDYYYVYQMDGDRVVLMADNCSNGAIYAAVRKDNLKKV